MTPLRTSGSLADRSTALGRAPWGTLLIFLVTGALFAAQSAGAGWGARSLLYPDDVRPHSVLTYALFHQDLLHWLTNMVFLWMVGPRLERTFKPVGLVALFVFGAIVAAMVHLATVFLTPQEYWRPLMGASGGIAALIGAYTVRFFNRRVGRLGVPVVWALGAWLMTEAAMAWRDSITGQTRVSHWAHVGGYLAGLVLAVLLGLHRTARLEAARAEASPREQAERLTAYLRENPGDFASRIELACVLSRLGNARAAGLEFQSVIEKLRAAGRGHEAADAFLAMRAADIEAPTAGLNLIGANLLEVTGHPREALLVWDQVAASGDEKAEEAAIRAAQLVERIATPEEARQRYQAFLLMFPDSPWAAVARKRLKTANPPQRDSEGGATNDQQ
jgi:membrane associated rhomboid family serine protease